MAQHANRSVGTFDKRCQALADSKMAKAMQMPPGKERDALMAEARQMKTASEIENWINSPGLKSPS